MRRSPLPLRLCSNFRMDYEEQGGLPSVIALFHLSSLVPLNSPAYICVGLFKTTCVVFVQCTSIFNFIFYKERETACLNNV